VRFTDGAQADPESVLEVWRAANTARGLAPSPARIARIREKLTDPDSVIFVGHLNDTEVAMALLEAARADDGAGQVIPGHAHLAMVFVRPEQWGAGIGGRLLDYTHHRLIEMGWPIITVWTRQNNERALRMYQSRDYSRTGRVRHLPTGDPIVQLGRTLGSAGPRRRHRSQTRIGISQHSPAAETA